MNKILKKIQVSEEVFQFKILNPLIAEAHKPGQFVIIQLNDDFGERIPLTIADSDSNEGTITIVFQTVGKTTHFLAEMNEGEEILHIAGPLGMPTHIEKFGTVVCVGGGIGIAPLHPIANGMKKAGNKIITILGARSKNLIFFEDKMKKIADEFIICTDDGSYGKKALVTQPLKELCEKENKPDLVIAIGPPIMMKFCSETTRPFKIPTIVSLNTIMVDGTGMCGSCRVSVGNKTKFVCVDGPEFDGHLVDFDNMIKRIGAYKKHEDAAHHKCHLEIYARKEKNK